MEEHFQWDPLEKGLVLRPNAAMPRLRADFVRTTRALYEGSVETLMAGKSESAEENRTDASRKLDSPTRKAIQAAAKEYLVQELNSNSLFCGVKNSIARVERR